MTSLFSIFEQLRTDLAAALAACGADPENRAVHSVRTSARRLEALLRKASEEHPRAECLRGDARRALRQLKAVRVAAGPVRDLDVQRKLAAEIAETLVSGSVNERKELGGECARLDRSLRRRRNQLAAKLTTVIEDAGLELERALEPIRNAIVRLHETSPLKTARSLMLRSSLRLNDMSRESLHRYRKQTKAARYLAEMERTSLPAKRLAKRLKRVLDDIGRWHDLMLLAKEAKTALGKRSMLAQAVKKERDRALRVAVRSVGTIRRLR